MTFPAIATALLPVIGSIIERIAPDKDAATKMNHEAILALSERSADIEKAAASIIQAEAASKSWLASSWRPITMLVFVALITARWFGWSAPNLSDAEALKLWDIVQVGLGGYIIGRSAEKITPGVVDAIRAPRKEVIIQREPERFDK